MRVSSKELFSTLKNSLFIVCCFLGNELSNFTEGEMAVQLFPSGCLNLTDASTE